MNKLIVLAHPSTKSLSAAITQAYYEESKKAGHEVEVLDLYKTELKQDFLRFENIKTDFPMTETTLKIQTMITKADEIVIICPVWWFSYPAILKNFFDCNFTSGFAYRYEKGHLLQVKMLKGKTARIFMTCNSPTWYWYLIGWPFKTSMASGTLEYSGIKVKSFTCFSRVIFSTEEKRNKWIEKVRKIAREK